MFKFSVKDIELLKFISQINELAERSGDETCNRFLGLGRIQDDDIKQELGNYINPASQVFLYDDIHPIDGPSGMSLYRLVRQIIMNKSEQIISYYDNFFVQDNNNEPLCLVAYPNMDNFDDCIYIEDGEWFFYYG